MQTIMFRALEQIEGRHKTHSPACWNTFKRGNKMLRQKLIIPDRERGIVHISYNRHNRQCTFFKPVYFLAQRRRIIGLFWSVFGQFWLFCLEFTHFLAYFSQALIKRWCTKLDKDEAIGIERGRMEKKVQMEATFLAMMAPCWLRGRWMIVDCAMAT